MPTTNRHTNADIDAICATGDALDAVAFGECNSPYGHIYHTRLRALCELKGCELADLTLREITSCRVATDLEYNDQFPVFFPGHQSRPTAEVLANNPQGALV